MEKNREEIVSGSPGMEENSIRLDDTTDLAFDLDVFLRKNVYAYAGEGCNPHTGMERRQTDCLPGRQITFSGGWK